MIVDAHAHIIVPEITREAAPRDAWRPRVYEEGGRQIVEIDGMRLRSVPRDIVHAAAILQTMSAAGVDRVLLCPFVGLLRYDAPAEHALESGRIQNDALAKLARAHPGRISALGTVPLQDPKLAARELEPLMEGGLHGVEIAASVRGIYLGDDRFGPFWDAAEAAGALVLIHPTTKDFDLPVLREYFLTNTVGNPLETTMTAAHMIMAGVMEAHSNLKVLLSHGGGAILSLRGRLRQAHSYHPQARARLRESPEDSLRRFYFDTITHDAGLLRALVDFAGPQHVVMGSDYPFDMGVERPVEAVRALRLPPAQAQAILGGNAARILGLAGESGE